MEKSEFLVLVKTMKAVHPAMFQEMETVDIWYTLLKDLDYQDAAAGLGKHLATSPYPPTVADIRNNMVPDIEMNGEQAWALVFRAIENSAYNSADEFAKLPELIQKAVGNPANLRELALMPTDTVNSVEKSHFLRTYEVERKRQKELAAMPKEIRERLQSVAMKMIGG
jgi:hypothetical protein